MVGVCDLDLDRANVLAEDYDVPTFTDLEGLLAEIRSNIVSVATPEKHTSRRR